MRLESLVPDGVVDAVEIISFPRIPPQYVQIRSSGRVICIVSDVFEVTEREERGVLKLMAGDARLGPEAIVEEFPGGKLMGVEYLKLEGEDAATAVSMTIQGRKLFVACGDAPYSLFVEYDGQPRGRPEFPLEDYVLVDGGVDLPEAT